MGALADLLDQTFEAWRNSRPPRGVAPAGRRAMHTAALVLHRRLVGGGVADVPVRRVAPGRSAGGRLWFRGHGTDALALTLLVLGMLSFFMILSMMTGGLYLAIDTTARERERGTLEPLLTTPVPREEWPSFRSLRGEAVERGRRDVGAVAAELRVPDVVEQHHHHVRCTLRCTVERRPPRLGVGERRAHHTFELLLARDHVCSSSRLCSVMTPDRRHFVVER